MNNTTNQAVPFAGGTVHVTLLKNGYGETINPEQSLKIQGIHDVSDDEKVDYKSLHGEGTYAVAVGKGKSEMSVKLTVSRLSGKQLNALVYGQTIEDKQLKTMDDRTGHSIPSSNSVNAKISNVVAFNLGRWDSGAATAVKIAGVACTAETQTTIRAGKCKVSNGKYSFAKADAGKALEITYTSNGTQIVLTTKVPAKLTFDVKLFSSSTKVVINSLTTAMTREPYNLLNTDTTNLPAGSYMASSSGVHIFHNGIAAVATTKLTVTHKTDGVAGVVSTVLTAEIPVAGYYVYIDPPSAAAYSSLVGITLRSNSGTAMTGVAVDESLSYSATPTSGEFDKDSKGFLTFAAADVDDTVTIEYIADYQQITITPPSDGTFLQDLGVRTKGGIPLTRVALTSPLSLLNGQYAADDNAYYFDDSHAGDTLYIDYKYQVDGEGQTIRVDNTKMGQSPTMALLLTWDFDGKQITVFYPQAKPKGMGIPGKQDDFAVMTHEFMCFVDPELDYAKEVSLSS